jgi:hypothetical protein
VPRRSGGTYPPPHLLAAPDNVVSADEHAHAVTEVRNPDDCIVGTGICDHTNFGGGNMRARAVEHG